MINGLREATRAVLGTAPGLDPESLISDITP